MKCVAISAEFQVPLFISTITKYFPVFSFRLIMNAKLFVLMGVTWTTEIVSSFVTDPPWIWYLVDAANALQGALIFCIFVLKRKVIRTLAHRLGSLTSDPTQDPTPLNNLPTVTTHIVGGRHPAVRHSAQPSQTADMAECCQVLQIMLVLC